MDTADYRELVDLLREQLRTVGAAELGDITLYSSRDTDTGDLQPVSPREHMLGMLQAFDRYLSIRDHHTFVMALERINEALAEATIKDAAFVPAFEIDADSSLSFGAAPRITPLRRELQVLIDELREDLDTQGPTE